MLKLTKKQQEMFKIIKICDSQGTQAFLEFGRYKPFDYRTFSKLQEKGLIKMVARDYDNKYSRPEWVKVALVETKD